MTTSHSSQKAPLTKKKAQGRDCPWLTSEITSKMNKRDKCLRKHEKAGKENDWSTYRRLRNAATRNIRYSNATCTRSVFKRRLIDQRSFGSKLKLLSNNILKRARQQII